MRTKQFRQQRGMVLIFTLVLLVLITLTSASQIQQNRLQLMMTAILQQQNQRFADAERALQLAKAYIESQRFFCQRTDDCWKTPANRYTCKTKNLIYTQYPVPATVNAGIAITGLPLSLGDKLTGITLDNGSTINLTQVACLSALGSQEEDCSINKNSACYSTNPDNCMTEIYTIESRIRDATGNERIVQSRYAIRCDHGKDV